MNIILMLRSKFLMKRDTAYILLNDYYFKSNFVRSICKSGIIMDYHLIANLINGASYAN